MTPAARLAAAIGILDRILAGAPAEQALTNWSRASRFAGSGDRGAVRDHVFDALRCRGSYATLGGPDGRGLMLGLVRAQGLDPALFGAGGHAPEALSPGEQARFAEPLPPEDDLAALDWPEWMRPRLERDLGPDFPSVSRAMRARAPVFLRVNLARVTRDAARAVLAAEGIATMPHPLATTALEVTDGARRIQQSAAYREGLVELQDAASQAAVEMVPVSDGDRVLDYCAGGGGKALALAARAPGARITAHDIDAGRMRDLPERAARAGARIARARPGGVEGQFDLVLVDAPCSGSGTWRRTPDAKWRLTEEGLARLVALQRDILAQAAGFVAPGGRLCYMTCSLLSCEDAEQADRFAAETGWSDLTRRRFLPDDGGDGFFVAIWQRQDRN
ncbi:RsmB/NOP family class I SAM-dependent RNA methyltransferase [Paenirhodobacter sp.]|uniref:RsmB/NOP family class I SAM-dependent RNA methyltransferase n=1 Tax=Paenirhodobacter sp. TaxID=1965326 RepID=UPI003B3E6F9F